MGQRISSGYDPNRPGGNTHEQSLHSAHYYSTSQHQRRSSLDERQRSSAQHNEGTLIFTTGRTTPHHTPQHSGISPNHHHYNNHQPQQQHQISRRYQHPNGTTATSSTGANYIVVPSDGLTLTTSSGRGRGAARRELVIPPNSYETGASSSGFNILPSFLSSRRQFVNSRARSFTTGDVIVCPKCNLNFSILDFDAHIMDCLDRPTLTYNSDVLTKDLDQECCICCYSFKKDDEVARLPCLCLYHKVCIDLWFEKKRSCPEHPDSEFTTSYQRENN